ncbi:nucleotidyl transferase AbiEii/AbiGii toxin family protein [Actinoplanes sp. TRM 88003]|uniref:Nucleotidyl transferase AbiEii/AbiGii toxin family protein n=1 Tax=Paractinoplanes aksuensis TaxID=2939490 RepID=A0ABT1E4D8_9ACTN|nr:nucleotidyl transferase AbiEii/AbiGii toxin family protein [Actinoplanes aksuensis]MCO8277738.1 nucleotidyl transferase AbiEii/AbiGii toxin family protein [Actinoplanes aksuensis]
MNPHRSVIDHILAVVADSPLADALVLRGSVTMLAWAGPQAREPADLDWIVRPVAVQPQDRWWPYPYVDGLHRVRTAPETVHRRPRDELWAEQDFDAEGHRPVLPPEGLHWLRADDIDAGRPHDELLELLELHPQTPDGIRLDLEEVTFDAAFGDAYDTEYEGAGCRALVPFDGGTIQLDFAYDEKLHAPAVLTAIPRADGPPTALWTASPELSLAWKLQWLATDQNTHGTSDGKDLYDAVLLAERPGLQLSPALRRMPGIADLTPATIRTWTITNHPSIPHPATWLDRLARALEPILEERTP